MIKLIETITFKDGRDSREDVREFPTRATFLKRLKDSAMPTKVAYDLTKKGEATVEYADAVSHLKVIEIILPPTKVTGIDGKPIEA